MVVLQTDGQADVEVPNLVMQAQSNTKQGGGEDSPWDR